MQALTAEPDTDSFSNRTATLSSSSRQVSRPIMAEGLTSLLQAKRALRVIHKIEGARTHRRQSETNGIPHSSAAHLSHNGESRAAIPSPALVPPILDSIAVHSPDDDSHASPRQKVVDDSAKGALPPLENGTETAKASPPATPQQRWQQAFRDVQAARHHLRRESDGAPPIDNDELWRVYGDAGQRLTRSDSNIGGADKVSGWWDPQRDIAGLKELLIPSRQSPGNLINLLILLTPIGWVAHFLHWSAYAIFLINLVALVPLAMLIGKLTEDLALRFGDTIGGLLNVTFGNAVELILSIIALLKGLNDIVTYSLIGSVLSNLLLVLGSCFFLGGLKYKEQTFNATANKASASLLFLAAIALTIPSAGLHLYGQEVLSDTEVMTTSYTTAIILCIVYVGYLYFQLKTHHALFMEEGGDEEEPHLTITCAVGLLGLVTVAVAFASEWLTDAITDVSKQSGLTFAFLGLIIIPIAGNAVEHLTAIYVAIKNKMDLAIAVALGSSIQISVFVIPLIVLVGWATDHKLSLAFDPFLVLVLVLSVIHAQFVSSDGRSNWMMGVQLIGTYVLIAVLMAHVNVGVIE